MNIRVMKRLLSIWLCLSFVLLVAWSSGARADQLQQRSARWYAAYQDFHGGLIVSVGCDDAEELLDLADPPITLAEDQALKPNVLIHALVVGSEDEIRSIREQIQKAGKYGQVTVAAWDGRTLPYADGMVNRLLISKDYVSMDPKEIDRVLAPLGVVYFERDDLGILRKPWPDDVDEWTHARRDATGNAVSKDQRAGPPRYLQWVASPRWNRGTKTSGLVSDGGRLVYILDDAHFDSDMPTWSIIARDAASGVQLWRRELASWEGSKMGKKVGPAQVNRRLIATGGRVYVPLEEGGPVSMLDAKNGSLIRTFEQTGPAEEFLITDGVLVALVKPVSDTDIRRGEKPLMRIVAVDPETGKQLWSHDEPTVLPMTVTADERQVVYHDGRVIRSLDLRTGAERWASPPTGQEIEHHASWGPDSAGAKPGKIILAPQIAPTMIIYDGVVAFAGGCRLNVISADDGRELWNADYAATNYSVPVDLFGFGGYLWGPDASMNLWRPVDDDIDFNAYDPQTGEVVRHVEGKYGFRFQHHRCHQMKVVGDQVVAGRAGIEFLDTKTGDVVHHHWTRGSCYYGILPANGRLYVPPHNCACYIRAKLSGFNAMNADAPARDMTISEDRRLQKGPAYGQAIEDDQSTSGDWPTYRHDAARSGRTDVVVGTDLQIDWLREFGDDLTSPVVAGGRIYFAATDTHTLFAVNAITGSLVWSRTVDARVDSPPTVYRGLVLMGCRDGAVRAFRAADGELVWRFRACPSERLIVSREQLESVWPVHGSVLVIDDTAYFVAGRSSYLDGGLRLYGLDPMTGEKKVDRVLATRNEDGSEILDEQGVDGCLSDILSSDGRRLFMLHLVMDKEGTPMDKLVTHLHGADGFLSDNTTSRLLWTYAPRFTSMHQGAFYDMRLSRMLFPSGRILVECDDMIYGFGQNHYTRPNTDAGGQWALFAAEKESDIPLDLTAFEYRKFAISQKKSARYRWWKPLPINVRAMVVADDLLYVAGPQGTGLVSTKALAGKEEAVLMAVSPVDGTVIDEWTLPACPTWDGMIAACGRIYLTLTDGQVICIGPSDSGRQGTELPSAPWRVELPPVEVSAEPSLVGRWRLDEGAGMVARDCSGRGHHARVAGRWVTDDTGTNLSTEGQTGALVIDDAPHLHFGTDDFSLVLRVKVEDYDARLIGKERFPFNWWVINLMENGRAELVLGEGRGPGQGLRAATKTPLSKGDWTDLAVVADRAAGEVRLYLDGKLDATYPIPKQMTSGLHGEGKEISIPSSFKPFRGLVDDLRIYKMALTAQRVKELAAE